MSTDFGVTIYENKNEQNPWVCAAGSSDLMTVVIVNGESGNAHISYDGGDTWTNVYTNTKGEEVTSTSCAMSRSGKKVALGFSGSQIKTARVGTGAFDSWSIQKRSSSDTVQLACSADCSHLYATTLAEADNDSTGFIFAGVDA